MSVRDLAIIWTPAANVWKRELQRLLGLITVVIPLDRFVATDSFKKLIFANAITIFQAGFLPISIKHRLKPEVVLVLNNNAARAFQRIEVTSFFKKLDTQSCKCHRIEIEDMCI
ncbi:hypothetical protein G9A89_012162 [Geosiphon pyriformis]|nr:hypothetical protein G9A89_012162 [Geosiphon pyriformis]